MCLVTNERKAIIAKKDIVAYKVMDKFGGGWITPFQRAFISKNNLEGVRYDISNRDIEIDKRSLFSEITIINSEGINSYCELTKAFKLLRENYKNSCLYHLAGNVSNILTKEEIKKLILKEVIKSYHIWKVIIPKGTYYWKSSDGKEIASKSIIFKEEVKVKASDLIDLVIKRRREL